MIMTVDDEGVAIVEIKNKKQEALLAITISQVMKAVPDIEKLVLAVMSGVVKPEDLGIETTTRQLGENADVESTIQMMKEEEAVDEKDLSPVLKRILKERADGKN